MSEAGYNLREAQNHSQEHSLSPFLAGGMIFPPLFGMLDPCQSSSNNENSSLSTLLDYLKKKNLYLSLSPSLASLFLLEQCLRLGITSTSSVCFVSLPHQNESLYVFPNCKSLWKSVCKMTKCNQTSFREWRHW